MTVRQKVDILIKEKLAGYLFNTLTDKLRKAFDVDTSTQRLDSIHICSNMRRLRRIGLFVATIRTFLVNLKRRHRKIFDGYKGQGYQVQVMETFSPDEQRDRTKNPI